MAAPSHLKTREEYLIEFEKKLLALLALLADVQRSVDWGRWHDPTEEQATLWKVEWDPAAGGSEDEVWQAVEVLVGGPVPR